MKHWRGYLFFLVYSSFLALLAFGIGLVGRSIRDTALRPRPITAATLFERMNPRMSLAQTFGPSANTPFFPTDFDRQNVPSTSACPAARTFYFSEIQISNLTGAAVTITIRDQQATPHFVFDATPVPANGVVGATCLDGCKLTSGFCWQAGAATSLDGYVKGWFQ